MFFVIFLRTIFCTYSYQWPDPDSSIRNNTETTLRCQWHLVVWLSAVAVTLQSFSCSCEHLRYIETKCENTSKYESWKNGSKKSRDIVPLRIFILRMGKPQMNLNRILNDSLYCVISTWMINEKWAIFYQQGVVVKFCAPSSAGLADTTGGGGGLAGTCGLSTLSMWRGLSANIRVLYASRVNVYR